MEVQEAQEGQEGQEEVQEAQQEVQEAEFGLGEAWEDQGCQQQAQAD